MPLHPDFPTDPYEILHPDVRWYPGDELLGRIGAEKLSPPLVHLIREGVHAWRAQGYPGVSETSLGLLRWWFQHDNFVWGPDGPTGLFRYRFGQREAVESAIWLYEVQAARDPGSLIRFDSVGAVSRQMFDEDWARYVLKLATGAGKTKVMSLLITWSYFHRLYEPGSTLSTNALLIAPNIIVLDRLRTDFDGARIFFDDPVLPDNGWQGRDWRDDFQMTVHIQDDLGHVAPTGNLFLTNIHRVGDNDRASPAWDLRDDFLGPKPVSKTTDSKVDLGVIVRTVPDLIVLNDEAHHVRGDTQWLKEIAALDASLRRKGSGLALQLDLTATPRHNNRAIFVQTISDYPLVEAIAQNVVKTPVVPDALSQSMLQIAQSDDYVERYRAHLEAGYFEWERTHDELKKAGKKSILFVMTEDTTKCDEVAAWLEGNYARLKGKVLVIHTKANGEISESASGSKAKELQTLRDQSTAIDDWDSPFLAVVSVMMLREGWDVKNVTTIVGLRPYAAESAILPEQTLGRGLRRMFGPGVDEKVSVLGTPAFMAFVDEIKNEGVELERRAMGPGSAPAGPMVIEVDHGDPEKDIDALDIELPRLKPRIERQLKDFETLDVSAFPSPNLAVKTFTAEEQRELTFIDPIVTGEVSHTLNLDAGSAPDWRHVVGWYTQTIIKDLRLVGGFDVLFGKVEGFIESRLFGRIVDLDDPNILKNLADVGVTRIIKDTVKAEINRLTVQDTGTTSVQDRIKLSQTKPQVVRRRDAIESRKSMFNKIAGDNDFELAFAQFLNDATDVQSFFKNTEATKFRLEYQSAGGGIIRDYYPDFIARDSDGVIWVIETKGREDIQDARKWDRLKLWCADATEQDAPRRYRPLFVREEAWDGLLNPLRTLGEGWAVFGEND
ncbi:DEAD/DEAH box helicase family protein [soil metagenome]